MNCYLHADREPVAMCVACGNFICEECRVTVAEKNYCKMCIEKMHSRKRLQVEGAPVRTTPIAIFAFICSILSWLGLSLSSRLLSLHVLASIVFAVGGIILGLSAIKDIRNKDSTVRGIELAIVAILISLAIAAILISLVVLIGIVVGVVLGLLR